MVRDFLLQQGIYLCRFPYVVRGPCSQRLPSGTGGGQEREQEEDQREVACIAQLVRIGPLMQEVPGSIPSVLCSTKIM